MTSPATKNIKSTNWADTHTRLERVAEALAHDALPPEKQQAILRQRAFELARPPLAPAAAGETIEVVSFTLGSENYGIDARLVREVTALKEITTLPGVPPILRGLVNLRSRILPALNLKRVLGLSETPAASASATGEHLLIAEVNDAVFGLVVDEVTGLREVPLASLHTQSAGLQPRHLRGVTAGGFVVLDLAGMIPDLTIAETTDF